MLSIGRSWIFYVLLTVLVGGHLYDSIHRKEHWPFSDYPMFQDIAQDHMVTYLFTVVAENPDGSERELAMDWRWVPSLPPYRLQKSVTRYTQTDPQPQKVRALLADYLHQYEIRRKLGLNPGPPIHTVRVYRRDVPLTVPPAPLTPDDPAKDGATLLSQAPSR